MAVGLTRDAVAQFFLAAAFATVWCLVPGITGNQEVRAMERMGGTGPIASFVVAAPPSEVDSRSLTHAVVHMAQESGLAVVYSSEPIGGVVFVIDEGGLLGLEEPAYAQLHPGSGTGLAEPAARSAAHLQPFWDELGITIVGDAPRTDMFWGTWPSLVRSVDEATLNSGYYMIAAPPDATMGVIVPAMRSIWERFGLTVVHEQLEEGLPAQMGLGDFANPYVGLFWAMNLIALTAMTLGTHMAAVGQRERLRVAAAIGLGRRRLFGHLSWSLATTTAFGVMLGFGVASAMVAMARTMVGMDATGTTAEMATTALMCAALAVASSMLSAFVIVWQVTREIVC